MVEVHISSAFQDSVNGKRCLHTDAKTVRRLFQRMVAEYPSFEEHLPDNVAVAINGVLFRDDWRVELPHDAIVHLLPRIRGG